MKLHIKMDHQIMRRSRRHLICDDTGQVLYAANGFADALQYLDAHEVRQVALVAGDRQVTVDLGGGALVVHDPRQADLPWHDATPKPAPPGLEPPHWAKAHIPAAQRNTR